MSRHPLIEIDEALSRELAGLRFAAPVHTVYNPLEYARALRRQYLERYGNGLRRVLLVGMNPGPFGMVQTGVPFGAVSMVRDWMGLDAAVERPAHEHPKRPIEGLACRREEVSGARLWGWARERFGTAGAFFEHAFVVNWCPLAFLEAGGRNRTPDKLPAGERAVLEAACDRALRRTAEILQPRWVVGVGAVAEAAARRALAGMDPQHARILHPSPASPAANRGWAAQAEQELRGQGVWADWTGAH